MTLLEENATESWITIQSCHEHNLKGITLQIPINKLTLICGVSGSGKSTLAHDVLFAEGQGRYLEGFSAYDRIFHTRMQRSASRCVDHVPPALALGQHFQNSNPRSTLGSLSDLLTPIRMLFARFTHYPNGSRPSRSHLSFNHPLGMCPTCQGLGETYVLDHQTLIRDEARSLRQGALTLSTPNGYIIYSQVTIDVLDTVCRAHGFSVDIPWKNLTEAEKSVIFFGSDRLEIPFGKHPLESRLKWSGITAKPREMGKYRGIIPIMEEILKRDPNPNILRFCRKEQCTDCAGLRLKRESLDLQYGAMSLRTLLSGRIGELQSWALAELARAGLSKAETMLIGKIVDHCRLLGTLSLGHLHLNRPVSTLSRGEIQSVRIAGLLGNPIGDMLYVLDEPASGLHPDEKKRVYRLIRSLLAHRCTILLVSHDRSALDTADWVVEVGPGGGEKGGELLYSGTAAVFLRMLRDGSLNTPTTTAWSRIPPEWIENTVPDHGTLSISDLELPSGSRKELILTRGTLTTITGISGSGKTTFLSSLEHRHVVQTDQIEPFRQIVNVEQKPLGKNSRSNPATYTRLFDDIRTLFAQQPAARERKLTASSFSFNSHAGACPSCLGAGEVEITLHHLNPLAIACESCQGRRYQQQVLDVQYKGLAIDEILNLTISQAAELFNKEKRIHDRLIILEELGLGYLSLGQSSSTLSGGEAQRVRLASFLSPGLKKGETLYLLDEPCQGLHDQDIPLLTNALKALVKKGATVVAAENNPLFIHQSDCLIRLGGHKTPEPDTDIPDVIEDTARIVMEGVRTRNLQNLTVTLPEKAFTVLGGPSGSGKNSLLFETLYKACQRRYAEHVSPYLRDRLAQWGSSEFDAIRPYKPALALSGRWRGHNPRSTVATMSGINDTLRVLFSRIGKSDLSENLHASHFSFNQPEGACQACGGLGSRTVADARGWLKNPARSILDGAFSDEKSGRFFFDPAGRYMAELQAAALSAGMDLSQPWQEMPADDQARILMGCEGEFEVVWQFMRGRRSGEHRYKATWPGFNQLILSAWELKKDHKKGRLEFEPVIHKEDCSVCGGLRLKSSALSTRVGRFTMTDLLRMPLGRLHAELNQDGLFSKAMQPCARERAVADELLPLLRQNLEKLIELGLDYLSLDRSVDTLSFGELQRLRLASFLSNRIGHCLFILDEISRGLHPVDLHRMTSMVKTLKSRSNTIVAIDHHPLVKQEADWLIELGPGSGTKGGQITFMGPAPKFSFSPLFPQKRSSTLSSYPAIQIHQARIHNLKNLDLVIPAQGITVLCGVSGSGKSTLLLDVIGQSALVHQPRNCTDIKGLERFADVLVFQQFEAGVSQHARLYEFLGLSRRLGLEKNRRLFCPHCEGRGETETDLDYLGAFAAECPECRGTGMALDSMADLPSGGSLYDLLLTDLESLPQHMISNLKMTDSFAMLKAFSLGHLTLNRRLATLSGGERKRLNLARILLEHGDQPSLFLLDEPDGGLSLDECNQLIETLRTVMADRHAALVVTHHPRFMTQADYLIDMGPGAGEEGGMVTAYGTPWEIVHGNWPNSKTAIYLKEALGVTKPDAL